jgi:hypothetical protein
MDYQLPKVTLTSITGYYDEFEDAYDNYDQTVYGQALDAQRDQDRLFSEELRGVSHFESPLNFTGGLFYSDDHHNVGNTDKIFPLGPFPGTGPYAGAYNTLAMHATNVEDSFSVFGEVNWKIRPDLELAGGARYSHDHSSTTLGNIFNYFDELVALGAIPAAGNPFSPAGVLYHVGLKETNVSPEATLTYHPTQDVTLYGAYKTGYLAGGSANPANVGNYLGLADPTEPLRFDKEKVKGGEIGAKGLFIDGRLQADLTVYRYKYTGLQVQTFDPNTTSYTVHNAGRALNQGIELQGNYRVARGFDVHGSLELVELKFQEYDNAQCYPGQTEAEGCQDFGLPDAFQNLSGTHYGGSPVALNVGGSYEYPFSDALGLRFSADVFYNSRSPSYERDPLAVTPAYTIGNVSATLYQPWSMRWRSAAARKERAGSRELLDDEVRDGADARHVTEVGMRQEPKLALDDELIVQYGLEIGAFDQISGHHADAAAPSGRLDLRDNVGACESRLVLKPILAEGPVDFGAEVEFLDVTDEFVVNQILDRAQRGAAGQVGAVCVQAIRHLSQFSHIVASVVGSRDDDRQVGLPFGQVENPRNDDQLNGELGVGQSETRQARGEEVAAYPIGHADTHGSGHRAVVVADFGFGPIQCRFHRLGRAQERFAFHCHDVPVIALFEQADAELALESLQSTSDRRVIDFQQSGCLSRGGRAHHGQKESQVVPIEVGHTVSGRGDPSGGRRS